MNAITTGALRPAHGYPPPLARLPLSAQPTRTRPLTFRRTYTGWMVYRQRQPLAWIVQGHHSGRLNKKPKTCCFVDVVFLRETHHGINLETADFETAAQTIQFIRQTFGGAA